MLKRAELELICKAQSAFQRVFSRATIDTTRKEELRKQALLGLLCAELGTRSEDLEKGE